MSAHDIVNRLDFCKSVREGEWLARCPSHDDKSPSLTIKDAGDGRTLVHCFAGCGANEVLNAIGLELQDLYPPTDRNYHAERTQKERTIDELVIEIARADRAAGKSISPTDRDREAEAFARLILSEPSPNLAPNQLKKGALVVARRESMRAQNNG